MNHPIDLDQDLTIVYVLETQYTGGRLVRKVELTKKDADKTWRFLTERASTDWVVLHEVTVNTSWRRIGERRKV